MIEYKAEIIIENHKKRHYTVGRANTSYNEVRKQTKNIATYKTTEEE